LRWRIDTAGAVDNDESLFLISEDVNLKKQAGEGEEEGSDGEEYQDYEDISSIVESTGGGGMTRTPRSHGAMNGRSYMDDIDMMFGGSV
jgi:hypothetical protein